MRRRPVTLNWFVRWVNCARRDQLRRDGRGDLNLELQLGDEIGETHGLGLELFPKLVLPVHVGRGPCLPSVVFN